MHRAPILYARVGARNINRRDKYGKRELQLTMPASLCLATGDPGTDSSNRYLLCNYYELGSLLRNGDNEAKPVPLPVGPAF